MSFYRVAAPTMARAGVEADSAKVGKLNAGEVIRALDTQPNAAGATRVQFVHPQKRAHGWVSVEAERLWAAAALDEAAEVAAAQPVPDDTSAVFRPNGAMGEPHAHLICPGPA